METLIHLDINDFKWEKTPNGNALGKVDINRHPKFQRTFTPKDLTLVVENKQTDKYAIFVWHGSEQNPSFHFSMNHFYILKLLRQRETSGPNIELKQKVVIQLTHL